jgi:anti-anti-sigma factor
VRGFGRVVARKCDPETRIPDAPRETGRERLRRQVLVAAPADLIQGGPAEDYERQINDLFRSGCRDLIADFRSVTSIDSAGVRALVRSHTTAQRLDARFTIVAPQPAVRRVLELARLDSVFDVRDSLDAARVPVWRHPDVRLAACGAAVCATLWWASASFPLLPGAVRTSSVFARELGKLVAAGVIGLLVTAVHRRFEHKPMLQAVEHAQLLLCVAGALVMMIIGESLAEPSGLQGRRASSGFARPSRIPRTSPCSSS